MCDPQTTSARMTGGGPCARRVRHDEPLVLRNLDRLFLILRKDIDHTVRYLEGHRADLLGRVVPETTALDHRRTAHPYRGALRGNNDVAARDSYRVTGKATPICDSDKWHESAQVRERCKCLSVDADLLADIVARAPAATLTKMNHRQPKSLSELEHTV